MRARRRVALVFGESENDRKTLDELIGALRPDAPPRASRRKPLVLIRDAGAARARSVAADIASVVAADRVRHDVRAVVTHQDCDAVEPAHVALAERIESSLSAAGVDAIAATPAWEMEAWLFLWPDAVIAAFPSWRRPDGQSGKSVGRLRDAKEAFRRATRPPGRARRHRDYEESDCPRIAAKVRELRLVDKLDAKSDSFELFAKKVRRAPF